MENQVIISVKNYPAIPAHASMYSGYDGAINKIFSSIEDATPLTDEVSQYRRILLVREPSEFRKIEANLTILGFDLGTYEGVSDHYSIVLHYLLFNRNDIDLYVNSYGLLSSYGSALSLLESWKTIRRQGIYF